MTTSVSGGAGESRAWYREWFDSPWYYKLYFEHNEKEAAGFIAGLLSVLDPSPDARMLDVACGRGRHSRILASYGYDVTGIDLAARSIEFARQYETEHLHFYQHDMRSIFYTNYFDMAFNFFTSFGYFRTKRENDNAIRSIRVALKKGGIFVLDYLNVQYSLDHFIPESLKEIDGTIYHLSKWYDETHFYKRIRIEDPVLASPLEYTECVARFTLEDFNAMFSRTGLQLQDIYGSYKMEPFVRNRSPRLILVARAV
jgi:SAM-dependent methyltransferase